MFSIISDILYFIGFILLVIAFITLVKKKEGTLKQAILEFFISIISIFIGIYIESGIDYIKEATSNPITMDSNISNNTEENLLSEHTHKEYLVKKENIVEATCINTGSYDYVVYCDCEKELKRENTIIEVLGHNYISFITNPTCTEQGFTTYTCNRCNDTYIDNYTEQLEHNYKDGTCTRCNYSDPNYVKVYDSEEIMQILSDSKVSDSGGYACYLGSESISVFAREQFNCFSIDTAVSYNLWGHEVQTVVFNVSNLNEIDVLSFDIGGKTGSSGTMQIEIFVDKTFDDSPDYTFELEASATPINKSINITNATSLSFRITNHSNNVNTLVFFNFSESSN